MKINELVKILLEDIHSKMIPYYLKKTVYANGKEFVVSECPALEEIDRINDDVLDFDLLELFPGESHAFKLILYRAILGHLLRGVMRKEWYFVYTTISLLSNAKVKIGVDLESLEFLKENLNGNLRDVYGGLSFLILNSLLEDGAFIIVEEYKDVLGYLQVCSDA